MTINLKDLSPINLSVLSTIISFIFFFICFIIIKPSFILEITRHKYPKINYYLVISYSLLFSILLGFIIINYKISNTETIVSDNKIIPKQYVTNTKF